jgi:hypothetical protein
MPAKKKDQAENWLETATSARVTFRVKEIVCTARLL